MITLLSDFGTEAHFVGAMKGVIAGIAPRTPVVDITHEVPPFEIATAAFLLDQSWRYFPAGTIHVAIVDPGVGSQRRPVLIASQGHYFIGPDNGLFSLILQDAKAVARVLDKPKYWLPNQSNTFHGRDVFSPAAAHLSKGVKPSQLGKRINDPWRNMLFEPVRQSRRTYSGAVLFTDRYGNLITNFKIDNFPTLRNRPFELQAGLERIELFAGTYSAIPPGELAVIPASSGYYEIAMREASAAKRLGLANGSPVELTTS
jgi:S-adenosyl-L-methionine hydrolase (adenosine-forming)